MGGIGVNSDYGIPRRHGACALHPDRVVLNILKISHRIVAEYPLGMLFGMVGLGRRARLNIPPDDCGVNPRP